MASERSAKMGLKRIGLVLVSVIVVGAGGACARETAPATGDSPSLSTDATRATRPQLSSAEAGLAIGSLATLAVKGRAPKTGYDRALFGQAWADVDRNGCDTRNDVLRRDLRPYLLKSGTHGCLVLSGTLQDPYLGRTVAFVRGQSTSSKVQIDHVVPLSDAWQKGAQQWTTPRRTAFANDVLNLLAVDGLTNQRKSDSDAATWLPPNKSYRCTYAARQIAVKVKYGLWVTSAEQDALARILEGCR
jgi:hypothetical protein